MTDSDRAELTLSHGNQLWAAVAPPDFFVIPLDYYVIGQDKEEEEN